MADDLVRKVQEVQLSTAFEKLLNNNEESDDDNSAVDDSGVVCSTEANGNGKKKKKKKKRKPRLKQPPGILAEAAPPPPETPEETAKWKNELQKGRTTLEAGLWGMLEPTFKPKLDLLLTPSCLSLSLETSRLVLRPCRADDLEAIMRIKLEPSVQKTQLYGAPRANDIREGFLTRYVRACMPRLSPQNNRRCRDDYIFAITLKHPSSITLKPGDHLRPASRISSAEGYLGNIALHLKPSVTVRSYNTTLFPLPGKAFAYPTFGMASTSKLTGELFYEIHPQLWGNGLMTEAFAEMLRFAFEEVGVCKIVVDPTEGNDASIKLALKHGLNYTHTAADNPYRKPQLFHSITREDWWARNRPNEEVKGRWEGKLVCRWCMNFRRAKPTIACDGCKWAKYCSRECQRADWVLKGGHQSECGAKY